MRRSFRHSRGGIEGRRYGPEAKAAGGPVAEALSVVQTTYQAPSPIAGAKILVIAPPEVAPAGRAVMAIATAVAVS